MKYIDEANGVWEYANLIGNETNPWELLALGSRHKAQYYQIGSFYTHKEVKKIGVALRSIETGTPFEFPVEFSHGQAVYVDCAAVTDSNFEWHGYDQNQDAFVAHYAGSSPDDSDVLVVKTFIRVPRNSVRRYA